MENKNYMNHREMDDMLYLNSIGMKDEGKNHRLYGRAAECSKLMLSYEALVEAGASAETILDCLMDTIVWDAQFFARRIEVKTNG